jgi:large subunit ribosomal protein L4e
LRKVPVYTLDGLKKGSVELSELFFTPFRPDTIHKVYYAISSHSIQPQGRDPMAGKKTSATTFNPPTGRGISRLPRVKGERYSRAGQAAGVASVVKGRQAHPPRSEKKNRQKVNNKEKKLATLSCIAATANEEMIRLRGHIIDNIPSIPLVVSDRIQSIKKSKELEIVFSKLGLSDDILRIRRRKNGKGPLVVVSEDKGICKASSNIPGVECVSAKDVSTLHLAPGCNPGRLVVWSKSSLQDLNNRFRS